MIVEGTDQDITEQKIAQEKIRENEERYRLAILERMILSWDIDVVSRTCYVERTLCDCVR